jgi:SAM-dependent methyltransferase
MSNVKEYRDLFVPFSIFRDKAVLELGCSEGYLLSSFLEQERFSAIGVDIDDRALSRGRTKYGDRIQLLQNTASTIPLPDASVDVVYSIDTFEHLSRPFEISMECHRVLRPGGVFFIHFGPWFGPDGSHLEDIITYPWPHVFFSMDTLLAVAAYLYDSDEYEPAWYWIDRETGERRPNPYLDRRSWEIFLNRMTIKRLRSLLRDLPFETAHFQCIGFGGKTFRAGAIVKHLAQVPIFREFFTRTVFCVLRKPVRTATALA